MKLKLRTTTDGVYYIKGINKKELDTLLQYNKTKQFSLIKEQFNIDSKNIKLVGQLDRLQDKLVVAKLEPYIDRFIATCGGRKQTHFRDYSKPIEKQKEMAWLINICSNVEASWRTIHKEIGKPDCCIVYLNN